MGRMCVQGGGAYGEDECEGEGLTGRMSVRGGAYREDEWVRGGAYRGG